MTDDFSRRAAWRILDANLNRASEGLRAVEEYARFAANDAGSAEELKRLRHGLTECGGRLSLQERLAARDTPGDVGTTVGLPSEGSRADALSVALANLKRTQQALRAIEEYVKLVAPETSPDWERLRYASYTVEQRLVDPGGRRARLARSRLYLLLDVRENVERTSRIAKNVLDAGVDVIQLRDKRANDRMLLNAGAVLREATAAAGALFIVNDRPDLALLLDADGVHVGQEEIPVGRVRSLVGPARLIGVSAHRVEEAIAAEEQGADYLGIGPTFPSQTKNFAAFTGVELIRQVRERVRVPWFAIGGIGPENVSAAHAAGADRVAVSGAVLDDPDPAQVVRALLTSAQ